MFGMSAAADAAAHIPVAVRSNMIARTIMGGKKIGRRPATILNRFLGSTSPVCRIRPRAWNTCPTRTERRLRTTLVVVVKKLATKNSL